MSSITPDETILGLLAVRARHGYELLDCFRDPSQLGEVWKLSTSQIYAVLKRLESQGLTEGQKLLFFSIGVGGDRIDQAIQIGRDTFTHDGWQAFS